MLKEKKLLTFYNFFVINYERKTVPKNAKTRHRHGSASSKYAKGETHMKKYTNWRRSEKKRMKDPAFRREAERIEPDYQLTRALIGARLARKMTQAQLAKKMDTKQPVVSRIESMASTPTVSLLKRFAKALNATLDIRFSLK